MFGNNIMTLQRISSPSSCEKDKHVFKSFSNAQRNISIHLQFIFRTTTKNIFANNEILRGYLLQYTVYLQ